MELVVLAGTADPRLPFSSVTQMVWRSTAPEIFSSRTPVTSEFGRCPRRGRSPLWREMELLGLAGTADPRLPLSCVSQRVWRGEGAGDGLSLSPAHRENGERAGGRA